MRVRRFGPFEADLETLELRRRGVLIALQPQPFRLLARLLADPGEIVGRDELRRVLWPDGVHVEFDHGLDATVNRLRRTLGDSATSPRFVETVPGRGVRFVAPVADPHRRRIPQIAHARRLGDHRTPRALAAAAAALQAAVETAPSDPATHAGLARTLVLLAEYGLRPPSAWIEARQAAQAALALDPACGEAHAARAAVLHRFDWSFAAAESAYRDALRESPDDVACRQGLAELLSQLQRHGEALGEIHRAQHLQPGTSILGAVEGWLLFHARRFRQAAARAEETLALDAGFPVARLVLGRALLMAGDGPAAVHHLARAVEDAPHEPWIVAALARAEARTGRTEAARHRLDDLSVHPGATYFRAQVAAALGDTDLAVQLLETALADRSGWLVDLGVDPEWDPIRTDPRFARCVDRVGLGPAMGPPA